MSVLKRGSSDSSVDKQSFKIVEQAQNAAMSKIPWHYLIIGISDGEKKSVHLSVFCFDNFSPQ